MDRACVCRWKNRATATGAASRARVLSIGRRRRWRHRTATVGALSCRHQRRSTPDPGRAVTVSQTDVPPWFCVWCRRRVLHARVCVCVAKRARARECTGVLIKRRVLGTRVFRQCVLLGVVKKKKKNWKPARPARRPFVAIEHGETFIVGNSYARHRQLY